MSHFAVWAKFRVEVQLLLAHFLPRGFGLLFQHYTHAELYITQFYFITTGENSVMPDFHKPERQNMLAETPQKLSGLERHFFLHIAMAVIFPRKSNLSIINRFYPVIGNGYFVGVASQVFYHLFWPVKRLFGIHHPFMVVEFLEQFLARLMLRFNINTRFEQSHKDFTVFFAQRFYRIQIGGILHFCGFCQRFPFALPCGSASRHNAMQVRMKTNVLPPSMQHGNVSALCTEIFGIGSKVFEREFYGLKQNVVQDFASQQKQRIKFFGQREYHMKITHIQQIIFPRLYPPLAIGGLTFWAMAVSTRIVRNPYRSTSIAGIHMSAQRTGATFAQLCQHASLLLGG